MKSIREVEKITGFNRRSLQEYDKKGMLVKTCTNKLGHWRYDDEAIWKLMIIKIFNIAHYKRNAIKELLKLPTFNIWKEFDNAIAYLENERDEIDGIIKWIKTLRRGEKLPKTTLRAILNTDLKKLFEQKSFDGYAKDFIKKSKTSSNADMEASVLLRYTILAIGGFWGRTEESDEVQILIEDYFAKMLELEGKSGGKEKKVNCMEKMLRNVKNVVDDQEELKRLELIFGQGINRFIVESFEFFSKKQGQK